MTLTYIPIASTTLSTTSTSVSFTSIPQTYTDLVVKLSTRTANANTFSNLLVRYNGATTNYSVTWLYGNGAGAASSRDGGSDIYAFYYYGNVGANATANTFSNSEIYIPNYTVSANKPTSYFGVAEDNATTAYQTVSANLWSNTAAITSIEFIQSSGFVSGSTFHLYGII